MLKSILYWRRINHLSHRLPTHNGWEKRTHSNHRHVVLAVEECRSERTWKKEPIIVRTRKSQPFVLTLRNAGITATNAAVEPANTLSGPCLSCLSIEPKSLSRATSPACHALDQHLPQLPRSVESSILTSVTGGWKFSAGSWKKKDFCTQPQPQANLFQIRKKKTALLNRALIAANTRTSDLQGQ